MTPNREKTLSMVAMTIRRLALAGLAIAALAAVQPARAQFVNKWLSAGSLHNWYSEVGQEVEVRGFVGNQQDGLRWPGIYRYRDAQAAKGLWIGAKNVTDDQGTNWATRVVHAGPRVLGSGEFFPVRFDMISRFDPPLVLVDGEATEPEAAMVNDLVDPTIEADRMIVNEVNTLLGLTMERRILQFSQDWHDNYHVIEYTFTNTGNTDSDPAIELPNQTLEDVVVFLQWRWSVAAESRYVIGNGTGWGMNAMLDTRGDGVMVDPAGEQFRAQFVWHGKFTAFTLYDNVGGPILKSALPAVQIAASDTLGRLGASQFVGAVTLHADQSPANTADDPSQPSTTTWIGSDEPYQSQNDAYNPAKMQTEYGLMTAGHKSPRHAWVVEPSGMPGWLNPTGDPTLGTPGGFSNTQGYGPYTLGPGESFRFVIAEASAGLSREANEAIGRQWQEAGAVPSAPLTYAFGGQSHTMTKNEWVFTSRDSLFQTFARAKANFDSGYEAMPRAPLPPSTFDVAGGGDRILLTWTTYPDADHDGFEIYRARGRFDSTYVLVHEAGAAERTYDDTTPIRGIDYYYYIVSTKSGAANDGGALTPAGRMLRSSRYYTQTYTPTRLKRPAGTSLDEIRVVPNPFKISSNQSIRFPDQVDKLAFFNIPGRCRIDIYTETGELVDTIEHVDGSGDAFWDHTTSSRQVVVSGLYIAVITDLDTGEREIEKFVIIR
jgi:hypothetical protein